MNDDFLKKYRKPPRPQFAAELYERISEPMETQPKLLYRRRTALAMASIGLILILAILISPPVRAFADQVLRQIGVFTLVDESARAGAGEPVDAPPVPTAEPPAAGQSRRATDAAGAGSLAGFTVLAPTYLPDGYIQEGTWSVQPQGAGVIVVNGYRSAEGEHFLLLNQYRYGPGDSFEQSYAQNEKVQDATVRGHPGAWITGRLMTDPARGAQPGEPALGPTNWLLWEENGVNYTLFGDVLGLEEMQKIAASLAP
jgi:hypothetical protein